MQKIVAALVVCALLDAGGFGLATRSASAQSPIGPTPTGQTANASSAGATGKEQAFRGAITDSMCSGDAGHTAMLTKGETLAQCTIRCVSKGAKYVLYSFENRMVYQLDDQTKPKALAAKNVVVVGSLDKATSTIHVTDMIAAVAPEILKAKAVYIDCDDCVRRMAGATQAATQALADWKRFSVVTDRKRADVIFLFAANQYLGDYVTREGPDTRPVRVRTTYMDVLDPRTGQSLWSDFRKAGSWRVGGATKDLIGELRAQMDAEQGRVEALVQRAQKLETPSTDRK